MRQQLAMILHPKNKMQPIAKSSCNRLCNVPQCGKTKSEKEPILL